MKNEKKIIIINQINKKSKNTKNTKTYLRNHRTLKSDNI